MSDSALARITLYLLPPTKERLQEIAKRDGRSMNDLIVQWVNEGLKADTIEEMVKQLIDRVAKLEKDKK